MSLAHLFRRGPTIAPIPEWLPTGPFFHGTPRGDAPPDPGTYTGLDVPDEAPRQRPPASPPALAVGDHLRLERFVNERPEHVNGLWPLRLYEIDDLVDLRWSDPLAGRRYPVADGATILDEIPAWRYFGAHGDGVPEILEQVWVLDPDRIASLEVPPGERRAGRVPIATLHDPDGEPGPSHAAWSVMMWMESRSWVAGVGGCWNHSYCWDVYRVTDLRWLVAMGLAHNAAVALAARDRFGTATVDAAIRAWQDLAPRTEGRPRPVVSPPSPPAGPPRGGPEWPRRGRRDRARRRAPRRR